MHSMMHILSMRSRNKRYRSFPEDQDQGERGESETSPPGATSSVHAAPASQYQEYAMGPVIAQQNSSEQMSDKRAWVKTRLTRSEEAL